TNFRRAQLPGVNFSRANLKGANLTAVILCYTLFADNDLSEVNGLETINHIASSYLSLDTLYKSRGKIPEVFLRRCGVPEAFIVQIPALVAAIQPIQFYSCFISYSSKDEEFAKHLYADLQNEGVRCWFAPEDMKIGDKIRHRIDESIWYYDKLLLVLSETSVSSQWVEKEVETAFEKEEEQKKTVRFPVR